MQQIVLLGAPGSGKGTISNYLCRFHKFTHVATGDIMRDNIRRQTEMGTKCAQYLEQGKLVPDKLTIAMVENHIKHITAHIVWDGFPRTVEQAMALDEILLKRHQKINKVLLLDIDEKKLLARIAGRIICPMCNRVYHVVDIPPKKANVCNFDGAQLQSRSDDTEAKFKVRLEEYNLRVAPLISYYDKQKLLVRINANQSQEAVQAAITAEFDD